MNLNTETGRYEFERRGQQFSITPEIRQDMIEDYISNNRIEALNNADALGLTDEEALAALRNEATEYVNNPYGWDDQEIAELEERSKWVHGQR